MISIDPKTISALDVYKIITGAIVPRPIAFVSTQNKKGQNNLAPFSFLMVSQAILLASPFALREKQMEKRKTL